MRGCARLPTRAYATATDGFMCYCGARAGGWGAIRCIGSTPKSNCSCARNFPNGAKFRALTVVDVHCQGLSAEHVETFNGSLRDECLNIHWFESLADAKEIIEAWRDDYNGSRPHSTLKDLTPVEYLRQIRDLRSVEGLTTAEN